MRKLLSKIDVEFRCFCVIFGNVISKSGVNTIIYRWLVIIGVKKILPLQHRYTKILHDEDKKTSCDGSVSAASLDDGANENRHS